MHWRNIWIRKCGDIYDQARFVELPVFRPEKRTRFIIPLERESIGCAREVQQVLPQDRTSQVCETAGQVGSQCAQSESNVKDSNLRYSRSSSQFPKNHENFYTQKYIQILPVSDKFSS